MVDICSEFNSVNDIKHHFEHMKSKPIIGKAEPKFGGAARWAYGLSMEVRREWNSFNNAKNVWVITWDRKVRLMMRLENWSRFSRVYIRAIYQMVGEPQGLDQADMQKKLENALMARPKANSAGDQYLLESNFDKVILNLFSEVDTWKRFQGEHPIPYCTRHDWPRRKAANFCEKM